MDYKKDIYKINKIEKEIIEFFKNYDFVFKALSDIINKPKNVNEYINNIEDNNIYERNVNLGIKKSHQILLSNVKYYSLIYNDEKNIWSLFFVLEIKNSIKDYYKKF